MPRIPGALPMARRRNGNRIGGPHGVGVFQLSQQPNDEVIEPVLFRQFEPVIEFEERHTTLGQPGKLKFLFYANDGFMGSYNQAVAEAAALRITPDISTVRARRVKVGGGLNLEQQITPSLGLFAPKHGHGAI